uniref:Uncharacterized protein n=3 Tax=Oryza TaxID=4527 RepID=Q53LE3_ORYSJ|nr:hypothetical protein LOC_Os11g09610 [Oryza sativa Japonica Group]
MPLRPGFGLSCSKNNLQDFDSLRWTTCLLSISRHLKRLELVSHSANQQILRLLELLGAGTSED